MSNISSPYYRVLCGIAVFFLLTASVVSAQPFGIKKYTINDGLPDSYILHVYQDSNGFLWIGTANGLSRFDGNEFVNYNFADGLPDEYVNKVLEDRQHRLWIGTKRGIVQMKGGKLIRYPVSDSLEIGFVFDIRENQDGSIWGLTDQGVYAFKNDRWEKLSLYPGLENMHCRNVQDTKDGLLINYGDYLIEQDSNGRYKILGKELNDWPFYNVLSKHNNQFYVNTPYGLFKTEGHQFYPMFSKFLAGRKLNHYFIDNQNRTWLSLYKDGLYVSYPNDSVNIEQHIPLSSNLISQVFEDRFGTLWLASGDGLIRAEHRNYQTIDSIDGNPFKLLRNVIADPYGDILISSETEGLMKADNGGIRKYLPNATTNVSKSFEHAIIDGYCIGADSSIWMVNRKGQLFTLQNKKLEQFDFGSMPLIGGFNDIDFNEKSGSYYISSDTLLEGQNGHFSIFRSSNNGQLIIFPIEITSFPNGLTLVGTRKGTVWMIDSMHRAYDYNNILGIPANTNLINFYPENEKIFWVSFSGGIKRYHWSERNIPVEDLVIDESNGLTNNSVYSLAFDRDGRMWAVTASGIITIQFEGGGNDYYIRKWNNADGITPENLRGANVLEDKNGNIWIQLVDRVYVFYAGKIRLQKDAPEIVITNVQLKLQETEWRQYTDSLLGYMQIPFYPRLPAAMNSLGIFYKGISFRDYGGLEYSFRLNGDSSTWSPAQKNGFISFVGLPPGMYHFLVKVKDSNNGWSTPAEFSFTILKPFWQRWWFILLVCIVAGYLVFSLFQFRLHERLMVLNVRQKLHRDLHDDIGATLSSIKVYTEVLQDDPQNSIIIGLIKENAEDMIGQLELISWATNPQNDTFKSLCDLMKKYALPACYAKKIDIDFNSDSIQGALIIPGNVRKNIFLVFKEAINNIIKYSSATHCIAKMTIVHRRFILEVSDDGLGMGSSEKDKGSGMQNMRNRAKELRGALEISSQNNHGVTIRMIIPFPFKIPYTWDKRGIDYH